MNFQKNIVYMLKNSFFFVEMLKWCGNIDYKGENFSYERINKRNLLKQEKACSINFAKNIFSEKFSMMIWEIIWNKEASRVFTEELTMIKDAEDKADRIRKDAKSEAGNIVDAANTKAGVILAEAEEKAREIKEQYLAEGQELAQKQYNEAISGAEKQWQEMAKKAGEKQDRVVNFIAERIVTSSVNC